MRLGPLLAVPAVPFLGGCGLLTTPQAEVVACEDVVRSGLDDPESYVREDFVSLPLDDRWQVGLEYTHAGSESAEYQICEFELMNGRADPARILALDPER